ncbi:DNA ecombination protein RadA [Halonotius sp. F2-221B]|uniref:ribonuclease H-like domain-containing protein n=1 Tax=Halonotius sp. F2-221B TaxID=2731620 RepID=UPI00398AFD53
MSDELPSARCSDYTTGRRALTDGGVKTPDVPELPPPDETPTRLLSVSGQVLNRTHIETVQAMIEDVAPDVIIASQPQAEIVKPSLDRKVDLDVLQAGSGMRPDVATSGEKEYVIVALPMGGEPLNEDQISRQQDVPRDSGDTPSRRCVVTQDVSMSVDPYERSATLSGVDTYRDRIPESWWNNQTLHLSTALRSGFTTTYHTSDGATTRFVGIGTSEADLGVGTTPETTPATLIECYSNGAIDVADVDPKSFGLRGVHGIGSNRIKALREAGITSVEDLVEMPLRSLAEVPGFGRSSAATVQTAAEARATETVVPTGDDSLPNQEPVFIDIETDGLNPSTAWLIGVLNGGPKAGNYMSFREQAVDDGAHLKAFMAWLTGAAAGRPVVAWNGYHFDFPVITEQLREHHPDLVDKWTDRYHFDAYYWATQQNGGNVALPGRTNKLEAVAEALGWEPTTNGIDGSTVAQLYSAYRRHIKSDRQTQADIQPDWARLEQYCEDDVRALATIYEQLQTAARAKSATKTPTGENSSQGSLADFS